MSLVKVYSHPRSGTHFLEAFLAKNFYSDIDLSIAPIKWGHWSNRQTLQGGNPYGKLFGSHRIKSNAKNPGIYIYRDGRAVALSVWKTEGFTNPNLKVDFSTFLKTKLDWQYSPGIRCNPTMNIVEHWHHHVTSSLSRKNENFLPLRYEDLYYHPQKAYDSILGSFSWLESSNKLSIIDDPVGLNPNAAKPNEYQEYFTDTDLEFFYEIIPENSPLLWTSQ